MGVSYLSVSAVCTLLSFVGLHWCAQLSVEKLKSDGLISDDFLHSGNARRVVELLLRSHLLVTLLAAFALNAFLLFILCFKSIFFVELYPSETRKLAERLVNYVIYKGTFLPLVVPPTIIQAGFWLLWLVELCTLKMFQALARDRLERLNASPSATPWTYLRVFSVLLAVLIADLFWIGLCLKAYLTLNSSMLLLLFFEPCSIAFETLQAIVVHGFQLLDMCLSNSSWANEVQRSKLLDASTTGSLLEWKGILIRNLGFVLDVLTLIMALGHYVYIWCLHGMAFHLVDAVLFMNIRALLSAIVKRVKGFIKLRISLSALHGALPDATSEELLAYEDECAICREPMAKAKKLHCNHLFHLACLRSWLDQGLIESPSCPTCRKPLFVGRAQDEVNPVSNDTSGDEQLARQMSSALHRHNVTENVLPAGAFANHTHNPMGSNSWRGAGLDSNWLQPWPSQGLDGAGPSNAMGSVGLGRVQMMMRHLASVGETYAQTTLEDSSWNLWPVNSSQAGPSGVPNSSTGGASTSASRYAGSSGGLHMRVPSRPSGDNMANILAMAETVREVLPHVPDELIIQDLQRTNSTTVTVNNLLQM
uniref:RING-type E3 ubiquitin transferase n=1 Tax=Kalanchoe fedtschenkoi TaxID=63787 RepID=A0A7N0V148_KALFE